MRALDASLAGIQVAEKQIDGAASRLARSSVPGADVDVATEMVALGMAKVQADASVAVARTVSQTIGTLVSTFV
jgi:hypothetical protein